MKKRVLKFKPGYLLVLEFSATGGVSYQRTAGEEEIIGNMLEAQFSTKKTIDHVELNKSSRAILNQAYHVLDKLCVHTPVGYWADGEMLPQIETELGPVRAAASGFNSLSRNAGSARRLSIDYYPLQVLEADEALVKRIARDVRDRLVEIRDSLKAGDRKAFEAAMDKARNLDRLATGIQADSVRMALESARVQKTQMLEAFREGFSAEEVAKVLDLDGIEAAITLFTDPEEAAVIAGTVAERAGKEAA